MKYDWSRMNATKEKVFNSTPEERKRADLQIIFLEQQSSLKY